MAYEEEDTPEIYFTVDLSKYPFFKNLKVGDKGRVSFKGEVIEQGRPNTTSIDDDDKEDEDDESDIHTVIKINDLIRKKDTARKGADNDRY